MGPLQELALDSTSRGSVSYWPTKTRIHGHQSHFVRDEPLAGKFAVKRRDPVASAICLPVGWDLVLSLGETNTNKETYANFLNFDATL